MWAVSDIVLELQSSGKLLAGKGECDPFAAALVQGLCAKIKALQGFNAMHAVEIKSAAETSFPIAFQASIGKAVEESLLATPASEKPSIAKPQTLVEIQNYLTRNDWLVLEDINSSLIQKQNTLAYRLRQLGVVSLHEQTCKAAVAVILNTLSRLPAYDVIHSIVMDFKGAFAASSGACKSGIYINKYPLNPSGLPPQVFKDAYGSEVPQPKVLEKLSVLKQHIPLRQTSKLLAKNQGQSGTQAVAAQPAAAQASIDPAPLQHGMMQFGLFPLMQQAMHFQQQILLDMQKGQHTTAQPMEVDATASSNAAQKALALKPPQKQTPPADNSFRLPLADGKDAENLDTKPAVEAQGNEAKDANDAGNQGKPVEEYEEAAFHAIMDRNERKKAQPKAAPKAKQAAKAKAKAKATSKAKQVMKRPSSKSIASFAGGSSSCMAYQPAAPTEVELKSTKNAYTDKHYHKCRDLAKARGYTDDDAKRSARKARAIAVELWLKAVC